MAAAAHAAERLVATAAVPGVTPHQALAVAVSTGVDEAAVAAAVVQRVTEQLGADMRYDAATIAADTACRLLGCGATPAVAVAAGARAALALARGERLEEVHADTEALAEACAEKHAWQCNLEPVEAPSWSMDGWLASLGLEKIVQRAWRQRFDAHVRESYGEALDDQEVRRFEQPFVQHLGECGSAETVLLLLKESPVLFDLATAIYESAAELRALKDAEGGDGDGVDAASAEGGGPDALDAEALNKTFLADAGELAFAHEPSVYWRGLNALVGEPDPSLALLEAMETEHCAREDADAPFTARNYGTTTSSCVEWFFVVKPDALAELDEKLLALGLPPGEWPEGEVTRSSGHGRSTVRFLDFKRSSKGRRLDAELSAEADQPLSEAEFAALRLYTGPVRARRLRRRRLHRRLRRRFHRRLHCRLHCRLGRPLAAPWPSLRRPFAASAFVASGFVTFAV